MPADYISPNAFEGSDSERINQAVQEAAEGPGKVVIPRINQHEDGERDIWLLDSAILLPANITIELQDCTIQLSDRCRDNFFRSANCGIGIRDINPLENIHLRGVGAPRLLGAAHPRATGDSAKTLGERTYGTDAGVAGESQTGDWRNIGILMAFVNGFSIENIAIHQAHCWAISLEHCGEGRLTNLDFRATENVLIDGEEQRILNQDGIDLRQGCHDIIIENITGHAGDDLVALTAIPHPAEDAGTLESTMISGAVECEGIWNVIIRNVKGYCAGGHHIVRLLNSSGLRIHDIIIDGIIDTSGDNVRCAAALKIGDSNPAWGGPTPLGDTSRILISNIISRARNSVLIGGSLVDSSITNVFHYGEDGSGLCCQSGEENVKNVSLHSVRHKY